MISLTPQELGDGASAMNWRKSIPSLVLWVVWLATRTALYLHATVPGRDGDAGLYQKWYACCFVHGTFPVADPMWQYPPGAALVFWLPGRLPGSYVEHFLFLAIGCDLAITVMLCWSARRGGSLAGAWYWVCGVPLLGPVIVGRFDVVPVALCVAALCVTGRGGVRGALIGAGAAVKLWPVTLLAGTAPGQWRRGVAAAAAVLAAACAIFPSATASFLAHQNARGVEIESVVATPFMIWRHAGWHGTVAYRFGAYQLSGGHVALALDASRLGLVLAAAAVIGWRLLIACGRARWRPEFAADAPLAATLLFLVGQPGAQPAVPALGHRPGRGVPGHRAHHAAPGRASRTGRGRAHAVDLPDRVAQPAQRIQRGHRRPGGTQPAPSRGRRAVLLADTQRDLTRPRRPRSDSGPGPRGRRHEPAVTLPTNQAACATALSAAASRPGCSAKSCHMRGHLV